VQSTRDRAGQPWRARHREILNRIVRETEPPTDSLPWMTKSGSTALDDAYYERWARCSIWPEASVPS
jgi:hypothetical protein